MSVRSHAKGCFIELDTLHEDGVNWETNYRWNYAVQVCTRIAALFPLVLDLECFRLHLNIDVLLQIVVVGMRWAITHTTGYLPPPQYQIRLNL